MRDTEEKALHKILLMAIICFVLSLGSLIFYFCYRVEPITECVVIEIGDKVSENYADYVDGMKWSVEKSTLDLSTVKTDEVGEYTAYLTHGSQEFKYTVIVQDTVAPVLNLKEESVCLKLDEKYSGNELIASVEDVSGQVTLYLSADNGNVTSDESSVSFDECGEYIVDILAVDSSGNTTSETVQVIVDIPPTLEGTKPIYIAAGCAETNPEIESKDFYLEGVMSTDEKEGDLSNKVDVNLSGLDVNTIGSYEIIYTVSDSYGLITEKVAVVQVMDRDDLQEKINTHQINRSDSRIIGAYNLYDGGYYEDDNVDFIQEVMEPAFVQIQRNENYRGSGFIIEITEEYVLICTNQHVVGSNKHVNIFFHEGSCAEGQVMGADSTIDIALVQVPMENISEELLATLKTVHINMGYWESIQPEDDVSLCLRCINDDGTVWKEADGNLISKRDDPKAEESKWSDMTQLGFNGFSGSSGSAILDGHGNLIAMARGRVQYSDNGTWNVTTWGVHLLDIVEFYESIMGKKIYYH